MRLQLPYDQQNNQMWNASIALNATVNFGFLANLSGTNTKPTSFTLNNAACSVTP